ncbi:helix-turn-helix domain-containing protein [Rhodanobacter sp. DHB23]|uniref:helix-turn-helix transcriptional regulator n=1 Tax=Rhodanobacter sp. DHB23 TaxID=2775923 RepID=UPI00177E9487|nr:helix-turn-helix domain-containing protein [Rhodanobacter sp. DHB23]MBD8873861.1 AlpA family phage regulatory protein [Rhodanobacter sp. DHB23]
MNPASSVDFDPLIPLPEAAKLLGTTRGNAWKWVRAGLLPQPIKLTARRCGFRKSTLEQFIAEREKAAA